MDEPIYYAPRQKNVERTDSQGLYILSIPGNYWKIGIAFDVYDRVRQLQTSCPEKIAVLCFLDTQSDNIPASSMERELHARLNPFRTSGEWFNTSLDVLESVFEEVWIQFRHPKKAANETAIENQDWMEANGRPLSANGQSDDLR